MTIFHQTNLTNYDTPYFLKGCIKLIWSDKKLIFIKLIWPNIKDFKYAIWSRSSWKWRQWFNGGFFYQLKKWRPAKSHSFAVKLSFLTEISRSLSKAQNCHFRQWNFHAHIWKYYHVFEKKRNSNWSVIISLIQTE